MLLMLDNYDSFTFNLVQYLQELEQDVRVFRNDTLTVADVAAMNPERIVISPGPGQPRDAGISIELIRTLGPRIPILGVCLGHQAIAECYGADVVHARRVMHGKTSPVEHCGKHVFRDLPSPFEATRYHSLVVRPDSVPDTLTIDAWSLDESGQRDEIMGLRHVHHPVFGVQFHPEAIFTEHGHQLLDNFLSQRVAAAA